VSVPDGWDPFAVPAVAQSAVASPDGAPASGSAASPRTPRGSRGKDTDPARLSPINEGSKRAAVALHFAKGWSTLEECEAATGIGARSIHSHLHDIHSYHGLGHEVDAERYRIHVPGYTVTCPKPPRKPRTP
jgi:hypothetical protein